MCLHYEQLPCYVWQWRVFTRWQHQYVSTLWTVTMLRVTVESIHQIATSVCVYIMNSYHVTCDSGEYSPDGNISMCLHYGQLPCYMWQWKVFTRWQHQYVSTLRRVTMLGVTVTGAHICLVLSRCVTELNKCEVYLQFATFSVCAQLLVFGRTCTGESQFCCGQAVCFTNQEP